MRFIKYLIKDMFNNNYYLFKKIIKNNKKDI
jgi:hypothetical protein